MTEAAGPGDDPKWREDRLDFAHRLLFETPGGTRFTQDSPILPNVWLAFALEPQSQQELILTCSRSHGTGKTALKLREMLANFRDKEDMVQRLPKRERSRVSYIPGQIAVRLYFDELMRVVLPLTPWWHETYGSLIAADRKFHSVAVNKDSRWYAFPQPDRRRQADLIDALILMRREIDKSTISDWHDESTVGENAPSEEQLEDAEAFHKFVLSGKPQSAQKGEAHAARIEVDRLPYIRAIPPDLPWLVRIAGLIATSFLNAKKDILENVPGSHLARDFRARDSERIMGGKEQEAARNTTRATPAQARAARKQIVQAFLDLYENWCPANADYPSEGMIWRVTKNRRVHLAVDKSSLTVKADAARRLFNVSCENITWAILDSGIDRTHPAFRNTSPEHERRKRRAIEKARSANEPVPKLLDSLDSRVKMTLDFTRLREMLDFDVGQRTPADRARHARVLENIARRISGKFPPEDTPQPADFDRAIEIVKRMRRRIKEGSEIDWQDLEEAIVVNDAPRPINDHGTHVAGILGADWIEQSQGQEDVPLAQRPRRMQGVCPDINLIDVRVFREDGLTDEFELLAAIQFLRWMNARAGTMQVHGANLSLSLIHEVRRFACGQTPICEECNEASALGMVIVAAAGNRGFEMAAMDRIRASDSYKSVSITDPGNAEKVITVGATHRKRPHEYGVSYFSSRGPTGDGRQKPDLVAPGEKIKGPTPGGGSEFKDGTSMAAPHVSGAAAMLMARHSELIGQPERIKQILCETATDLGRERYFQGCGLVDSLRALQSV